MTGGGRVHIIGAGLAGLSSAVHLTKNNVPVSIYEASGMAGGRCRSWMDGKLGCMIDNGNHLILSANRHVLRYVDIIGSKAQLAPPQQGCGSYAFIHRNSLKRFHIRHGRPLPFVPLMQQISLLKLLFCGNARIGELFDTQGILYRNFLEPLAVSALNTPAATASARLLRKVLGDWIVKSRAQANYYIPSPTLDAALVTPAVDYISARKQSIAFHSAVKSLEHANGRVTKILFQQNAVALQENDRVILAVPPQAVKKILPELAVELTYHPIVNVHFLMTDRKEYAAAAEGRDMLGVLSSPLHWIFFKPGILSTTSSAADILAEKTQDEITAIIWEEVRAVCGFSDRTVPEARVIVEARATFASTPENDARRPSVRTRFPNCFLAGDYVQTGMPGAIESAVLSGVMAAGAARTN